MVLGSHWQRQEGSLVSSSVVPQATELRALSSGIAPAVAIQWLSAALKVGEEYCSSLISEPGIAHALLATGHTVVTFLAREAPRLIRCLLERQPWSDLDDTEVETPVRIATAHNSPWCMKWTEIALSSFIGDTDDGDKDAVSCGPFTSPVDMSFAPSLRLVEGLSLGTHNSRLPCLYCRRRISSVPSSSPLRNRTSSGLC